MKRSSGHDRRSLKEMLLGSIASIGIRPALAGAGVVGLALAGLPRPAEAIKLYDGTYSGNNLEITLSTTVSYSVFERVNDPSAFLEGPGNANGNDSDSNFQHGIVGNEFQILPTLDVRDGNFGAHVSGEGYLNTVYLQHNQNSQPGTFNPFTVPNNSFTSATRNVNGQDVRLLDAFVYGRHFFDGDSFLALKVGRQTLLWGQSLFFTGNGIAAGQAPIDIITAQGLPNPQAQQVFLPVGQVVATYHINATVDLQTYYQFEYQHDNFQGAGAYFNSSDLLDKGAQRLILVPGIAYLNRAKDITPPIENGQFGGALMLTLGNYDVGFYGLRYDAKAPEVYANFTNGTYYAVYPRDIQIYGASFSTTVGPANVAGEISGRRNMPLVSGLGISSAANPGGANNDPLYAVGSTVHAQLSELYASPGIPGDPGGVGIDGEVEFNHVISVDENKGALAPGRQASAAAFDISITPTYYDVLPNFEVTFPISVTYNVLGRSEIDQTMQHGTGNFTLGVTGTYNSVWVASINYKDYLGKPDTTYNGLADRGFVSFNLQYTF